MDRLMRGSTVGLVGLALLCAAPSWADGTRQLGTGGATQLEGSAGAGIVPWASIAGYSTREERGLTSYLTRVDVNDFDLTAAGVAIGLNNRFEFSLARQRLDISAVLPGRNLEQDIVGLKARLYGDMVYTAVPQITLGIQHKRSRDFDIARSLGARSDSGTDVYLSATKLWLAGLGGYNTFANATVRLTEANQLGLLGFGGDRDSSASIQFESSIGVFLTRRLALGIEYRQKPDNLSVAAEDEWWDAFVAYFPNRRWSLVGAYVDLGSIANLPGQSGVYLSVEGGF